MTTGIIIQARMTSERFPGKVIKKLLGVPVIEHLLTNLKTSNIALWDEVIVAIPLGTEHAQIEKVVRNFNKNTKSDVKVFYGEELNVLSRYYIAAKFFKLDVIVRLTADCPFIDPTIVNKCITLLNTKNLDYVSNVYPERTFSKGLDVEVFTFDCLEACWFTIENTGNDISDYPVTLAGISHEIEQCNYAREHVTSWMQQEDEVRKGTIKNTNKEPLLNLCVDYPSDIERLEKMSIGVIKKQRKAIKNGPTNIIKP